MIRRMLQEMFEWSRGPELGLAVQEKITRKIALCHRLQNFFEENKSLSSLQSFEYLSTALMISAKLFENEEDVKSFKKHSKCCNQSASFLKNVELKILNRYSWQIDHSCLVDFGLNFISNFLFRSNDLIHSVDFGAAFDLTNHFCDRIGHEEAGLTELVSRAGKDPILAKVARVGSLSPEKQASILHPLLNSFKNCLLKLIREKCFKSNLKGFLALFLVLQLKEFHVGIEYHVFHLSRKAICKSLARLV